MNKRTELRLRLLPIKFRLRRLAIYWLENAIDRLDIDKCTRYENSVTFRDFIHDDDLFTFDDDDNY
jgi:hypothetical protein